MTDLLRQEVTAAADTIVVKVGTRVLTHADSTLDDERIARLAEELNGLIEAGRKVVLVSSGAVGAGMSQLGIDERPRDVAKLQAVAAVGQTNLIEAYDRTFRQHGRHAAQVLLTADDLDDRTYASLRLDKRSLRAIVQPPWKLVHDKRRNRERLYHLVDDPGESRDVSAEHSDVAARLRRDMDALSAEAVDRQNAAPQRSDAELPPGARAQLEELGYIERETPQ